MLEHGTFPEGLIHDGRIYKQFTLEEENFGHTLGMVNEDAIDMARLSDSRYESAALFAQRLTIEGVEKITPDMILGLSAPDGNELIKCSIALEARRLQFRKEIEAAQETAPGADEVGLQPGRDPEAAGGGGEQPAGSV